MKHSLPLFVAVMAALFSPCRAGAVPVPVWRFWSPAYGKHFYTIDESEKDWVVKTYPDVWQLEGVAYRAFASWEDPDLVPVYRFWSASLRSHFYTVNESEKDWVIQTYPDVWTFEGVVFYAYPAGRQPAGTMPVYRFWSGSLRGHFYTASDSERFKVLSGYRSVWQDEGVAWYAYPPEAAAPAAIVKGPYVQQIATDSATIMWETDIACDSQAGYGKAAPGESTAWDPALVTLHRVVLSGLEAGAAYLYQADSGGAVSEPGMFTTAPSPGQAFRFAVYGDSRSNPAAHAEVARDVAGSRPGIVFHTGDLIASGTDYSLWQTEFFAPAREVLLSAPVVPVLGNHEYGTGPMWFYYFFDRPLDQGWWALTYGNSRFIGLDTDVAYTAGSPQQNWLLQEFASDEYAGATWHVVFFHHPAFSCTTAHADDAGVREHLVPLFEQHGVDLVFQGHSHTYERYQNNGIYYIVTAGGGAPLYPLAPDVIPPIRQFGLSVHHYCTVDVDPPGGALILRAIDTSGRIFDTVSLSK
jgi:predicted phosphodiesterase